MRIEEKKNRKQEWKPGNMLYPLPAVMVSCADREGNTNILTVAWTGTVCTNPPMLSISVRPERYSCPMIQETGEFVVNLTTEKLVRAADLCGVKSGRDVDKWKEAGLTPMPGRKVKAPLIRECPVNLECRVEKELPLGSHIMFLARVVSVSVDEEWMDEKGRFHLDWAKPVCYSHGGYFALGKEIGTFGFSVAKKKQGKRVSWKV
ncbi:MAG TPA: flavin reductase family protein [Candidatus Eisenbergiella merdipullorum]|uniref:Flavin reductase family protein n=1 Tax=Candidatus Eisenbergiella merdipullorum TaxID=2838553 RepID=A0A9D2I8Y1_9FIRM|nr:flavin reductase family protein [Candidatus Eisenbergiella merdipullorum]